MTTSSTRKNHAQQAQRGQITMAHMRAHLRADGTEEAMVSDTAYVAALVDRANAQLRRVGDAEHGPAARTYAMDAAMEEIW
jgi:hypothetical protein